MNKILIFTGIIFFGLASILVAQDISTFSTDKLDGVYTGTGYGFKGEMTVEVTIKDKKIVDVTVVSNKDDRNWFNRANKTIPSAIVEAQTYDVDVVSGATYSSKGIISAVENALSE